MNLHQCKHFSGVDYNPQTGEFFRGAKRIDHESGRCRDVVIEGKKYLAHRAAWMFCFGSLPDGQIDHINRNPQDNRIENLRVCNQQQNQFNTGAHADSVYCKEKNVTFDNGKWKHCWQVHIKAGAVHFASR